MLRRTTAALLLASSGLAGCGGGGTAATADGGPGAIDAGGGGGPDADLGPPATIHLIGRFELSDPAGARFAWPGSAIHARFDGTSIDVMLDDGGQNQFSVSIDGQDQPVLVTTAGAHVYPLASGLAAGEHDVVLRRRTESFFGVTQFLGFPGATLVPTTAPYGRLIEFVGDSITCGYGVLGDQATCPFSASTESESDAYGALTAAMLDAGHVAIAYSGIGVYRNNGGEPGTLMPAMYERTFADDPASTWAFAGYTPDVVVVNLGTNDFSTGDPGQPFVAAYDAFVQQIRGHYPAAFILIATSPMLSDGYPVGAMTRTLAHGYLSQVVASAAARGDQRVALVDLAEQLDSDGYGCDYHPNRVTQLKMATVMAEAVRGVTGW